MSAEELVSPDPLPGRRGCDSRTVTVQSETSREDPTGMFELIASSSFLTKEIQTFFELTEVTTKLQSPPLLGLFSIKFDAWLRSDSTSGDKVGVPSVRGLWNNKYETRIAVITKAARENAITFFGFFIECLRDVKWLLETNVRLTILLQLNYGVNNIAICLDLSHT